MGLGKHFKKTFFYIHLGVPLSIYFGVPFSVHLGVPFSVHLGVKSLRLSDTLIVDITVGAIFPPRPCVM